MEMPDIFLTDAELSSLTGIRKGKDGVSREALQVAQLRRQGIPFYENARGRAIVVREALTGNRQVKPKPAWEPKVLQTS